MIGLQLTHSGRFCKPNLPDKFEPRVAYHHPVLDAKVGISNFDNRPVWTDGEIRELIEAYVVSAKAAQTAGFQFVDVKCCHGYLGHEFLSAFDRPGPYGGDFEGRTRFIREIIAAIRTECPELAIGVRLSLWILCLPPRCGALGAGEAGTGYSRSNHRFRVPTRCLERIEASRRRSIWPSHSS